MNKQQIEFPEFLEIEKKLEITVGEITSVEEIPKSDKLLKLEVDFGGETKVAVTNIKPQVVEQLGSFEALVGLTSPFVMNLKPSSMMGVESQVMIMPFTDDQDNFIFSNLKKQTTLI